VSQEQDALVWPPPNHAVEENPALQQLLQAQQARNKREQEQRAAERVQSGSTAGSRLGRPQAVQHETKRAVLAVKKVLRQRTSIERPILSHGDLSDLRVRLCIVSRSIHGKVQPHSLSCLTHVLGLCSWWICGPFWPSWD
jgi:hypothetical protein